MFLITDYKKAEAKAEVKNAKTLQKAIPAHRSLLTAYKKAKAEIKTAKILPNPLTYRLLLTAYRKVAEGRSLSGVEVTL